MTGPLDELRRLDAERTPGEWHVVGPPWNEGAPYLNTTADPHGGEFVADFVNPTGDGGPEEAQRSEENAAFIAACSRLVPVLLDRLDQLEAVKDAALDDLRHGEASAAQRRLAALPSPAEETP